MIPARHPTIGTSIPLLDNSRGSIIYAIITQIIYTLAVLKRAVYENERSPYLKLLRLAGCGYGDVESLVKADGIEPTLHKLREKGVYISFEEFKG